MNNNIQDPNNQVPTQVEEPFDPRTIQPQVIGELRKDRVGKPILVLEMLVLFGIVLIALPIIYTIANDEDSIVYKWLNKEEVSHTTPVDPVESKRLNANELNILSNSSVIEFKGIVIQNIKIDKDKIVCRISCENQKISLDEKQYFFEIYTSETNKVASLKLTGEYDNTPTEVTLPYGGSAFNQNGSYYGKFVVMNDSLYPEVDYSKDSNEVGSIVCQSGNHILTYTFKNDYLISIKDLYKFEKSSYEDSEYLSLYREYQQKSKVLGESISTTDEDADGFSYKASFNLESGYKYPDTLKDNNYYDKDTKAKVIHYTQIGKGFDCK